MYREACSFCKNNTGLIYPLATDYITGDKFQIWQCRFCQLAFTEPVPPELSRYYPAKYRRYSPLVQHLLHRLYRQRVRKWVQGVDPGSVFEIGCGDGLMLDALRRQGWQVMGSERTPEIAEFARTQMGIEVVTGDLASFAPPQPFDLIILFQVLEHLENPFETLIHVRRLLKSDGRLLIGVPNFASWQARFGGKHWFHLDVPRHLFHYNPVSLTRCLEQAGFTIEKITFVSWEHDPYGWVQTLYNRLDSQPNRLTRLLMGLDGLHPISLLQLVLLPFLTPIAIAGAIISWVVGKGALMQIKARPTAQPE